MAPQFGGPKIFQEVGSLKLEGFKSYKKWRFLKVIRTEVMFIILDSRTFQTHIAMNLVALMQPPCCYILHTKDVTAGRSISPINSSLGCG